MFKHKLTSKKKIKVEEREIWGLCEERLISVSPRLRGISRLDTYVHELLHAEFPEFSEKKVTKLATSMAEYLWKAGYRNGKSNRKHRR